MVDAAGGAAAISALKPPEEAPDHEDDKTCPDPENNCQGCDGKDHMCTSGKDSGCESPNGLFMPFIPIFCR